VPTPPPVRCPARCPLPHAIPNPHTCTPLTYCVAVDAPVAHAHQRCEPRGPKTKRTALSTSLAEPGRETENLNSVRPSRWSTCVPAIKSCTSSYARNAGATKVQATSRIIRVEWQFAKQAQISAAQRHSTHSPLRVRTCSPAFCAKSTLVCTFMSDDFAFNITGFLILQA